MVDPSRSANRGSHPRLVTDCRFGRDAPFLHLIQFSTSVAAPRMDAPKPRILVVDDEVNVLLTVEAILRQEGYEVDTAPNGQAALDAIARHTYDLVLTDLKMPGIDGMRVLEEVRKRSPATGTIMMTGYGSLDSALEAVHLGAYEYLLKPTEVPQLKLAVKRCLERKRLSEIDTLYRVSRELIATTDFEHKAQLVCEAAHDVLGVNFCRVVLAGSLAEQDGHDRVASLFAEGEIFQKLLAGKVASLEDDSCFRRHFGDTGVLAAVLVPGVVEGRLVCALYADNGDQPFDFHASALRFLQALADQAALSINNAMLITELKGNNGELAEANRKLREIDELKSRFLSVATHELRTPLTVILGYNSMLAESLDARLDEEERATLRESITACKRLIRLINSMLDISRIEAGRMQMHVVPTDMRQVVNGVVALFQHEARSREVSLHALVPQRMPRVPMDAERIQQVLINLVGNALKFTDAGGTVTIALHLRHDIASAEVSVSDTGIGIAAEDQGRIFEEFARVTVGDRPREGSGLGLAIARRIVEAHEGRIRVSSTPGKGSSFTFTLPLKASAEFTAVTA